MVVEGDGKRSRTVLNHHIYNVSISSQLKARFYPSISPSSLSSSSSTFSSICSALNILNAGRISVNIQFSQFTFVFEFFSSFTFLILSDYYHHIIQWLAIRIECLFYQNEIIEGKIDLFNYNDHTAGGLRQQ